MILLLSPAKAMNEKAQLVPKSTPVFLSKSKKLAQGLALLSPENMSHLMKLSPKLAKLNFERFQKWRPTKNTGFAAAELFDGPAFRGLSFASLDAASQKQAQQSLRILSGLYGVLRPLDAILPYRLEMGTSLAPLQKDGLLAELPKNLYEFWGSDILDFLTRELSGGNGKKGKQGPLLINLASQEYAKAARLHESDATILSPVFLDRTKNGQYKTLMVYAKRARGLLARFLIESRAKSVADVYRFSLEGYRYDQERSRNNAPVFVREKA